MYGLPDFTVGGALRRTFEVVKLRAATLLGLGFLLYAVPVAALGFVGAAAGLPTAGAVQAAAAAHRPPPDLTLFFAFLAATVVVQIAGFVLAGAAAVRVGHEALRGRPASFGEGAAAAFRVLPSYVGLLIVSGVATGLAFLLLIVPGVMLFCRWSVAAPALVVERGGVLDALGRSRDLTRGHRWAVLGFLLVMALINGVVVFGLGLGGGALGVALIRRGSVLAGQGALTLVGVLGNAVVIALSGASGSALYFELRRAGEGTLSAEAVDAFA